MHRKAVETGLSLSRKIDEGFDVMKKKILRIPELLAPGGSFEGMRAAVNAGADAVYMGGSRFGARACADNPDEGMLLKAIDYCHLHGRKLYLTVNTLFKEEELLGGLYAYLKPYYEEGLDAVLVQDLGAAAFIRRELPGLALHASTQMSIQSLSGALLAKELGFERIVPARELSLGEIRKIKEGSGLEVECFIHGALCFCYSGQCLLSSMIGGRSGNRGRCAQPCRQSYRLEREDGREEETKEGSYLLSLKDICMTDLLGELAAAEVASLKIEGRMKRPEYAAGVVRVYRACLDRLSRGEDARAAGEELRQLMDLYNRGGFSEGYYHTARSARMMASVRPNHAGTAAVRISLGRKGAVGTALEELRAGDQIELEGGAKTCQLSLKEDHPKGSKVPLPVRARLKEGQILPRVQSPSLYRELEEAYLKKDLQEKINGNFMLRLHEPAILEVLRGRVRVRVEGAAVQEAQSAPADEAQLRKQLEKTGDTPFVFDSLVICVQEDCFLPVREVNRMRREALRQLEEALLAQHRRVYLSKGRHRTDSSVGRTDRMLISETGGTVQADSAAGPDERGAEDTGKQVPALCVLAETKGQLLSALEAEGVSRIYLDCLRYLDLTVQPLRCDVKRGGGHCSAGREADLKKTAGKDAAGKGKAARLALAEAGAVRRAGKECFLVLPPVWREKARSAFYQVFDRAALAAYDGFLLRCADQIPEARDFGGTLAADGSIYTWNSMAQEVLLRLGVREQTFPAELNSKELPEAGAVERELVVYGRQTVMITAQCLTANASICRQRPGTFWLRDRKNLRFPVKNHCGICTNVICNSLPTVLTDEREQIERIAPERVRISLTTEDAARSAAVIKAVRERMKPELFCPEGYTRGHFRRGVE